jgi:hypothetical protein
LCTARIEASGLRCNGNRVQLQGLEVQDVDESQLLAWRQHGHNTLLMPANARAAEVCVLADRYGFFVLVMLGTDCDWDHLPRLAEHTCCIGWIARQQLLRDAGFRETFHELASAYPTQAFGIWLDEPPDLDDLSEFSFLYVDAELLDQCLHVELPKLVHTVRPRQAPPAANLLGSVQDWAGAEHSAI